MGCNKDVVDLVVSNYGYNNESMKCDIYCKFLYFYKSWRTIFIHIYHHQKL